MKREQKTSGSTQNVMVTNNRLYQRYRDRVVPTLMTEFGFTNPLAVPRLVKIVVSTSFREEQHQDDAIAKASAWMAAITGQLPKKTKARKAIATFNIRQGDVIGLAVTLRGRRAWEFADKLISAALPRVKDFQGVPLGSFDGNGNYTLGVTEQIIFPEVEYDTVGKVRGLQVSIVTSSRDDTIARKLLEELGMPFEKREDKK